MKTFLKIYPLFLAIQGDRIQPAALLGVGKNDRSRLVESENRIRNKWGNGVGAVLAFVYTIACGKTFKANRKGHDDTTHGRA